MKKSLLFVIIVLSTSVAYADTGASGISDAAGGVATYMPYVRALCYVIAAIIAIVGAVSVYIGMHTHPQQTTKRIMMTVGSCLCFVGLSFALPQFFGMDGNATGSSSSGSSSKGTMQYTSNGTSFLVSDEGGSVRQDY